MIIAMVRTSGKVVAELNTHHAMKTAGEVETTFRYS
jgi:hypothetical protein